jgi:hypothetical protein
VAGENCFSAICTLRQILTGWCNKRRKCSTHGSDGKCVHNFSRKARREGELGRPNVDNIS